MERRLSAILAADMVGYSRLMEADDIGTIKRQKAHRLELIDPALAKFQGRIVKEMGDGILVEFPSVVNAIRCAAEIQQTMEEREADLPQDRRIKYRVGINLGDVIVENGDLLGDGVNVAARLEQLAQPGGICISGAAYDQIEGRSEFYCYFLGEQKLKNISRPIRTYRVSMGQREADQIGDLAVVLPEKPSIAVLPFENLSHDPEQEYFADGITEDLIIMLGRCRWLLVIARNSTFSFKNKQRDIRQVSQELGAKYVLEGTVRRSGNRVRVTAQLSNGESGTNVFSERYDRLLDDIFELQEELATIIAGTIEPELSEIEGQALRGRQETDLGAWDSFQKGLWHLYRFNLDDLVIAQSLFKRAIEIDGNFSQAYARLAEAFIQVAWDSPRSGRTENIAAALSNAKKSVELDSKDPIARLSFGRALSLSGRVEEGIEQLRAATSLDPSFAQAHFALGQALTFRDRYEEAIGSIDQALRLSPRDPHLWSFYHVRSIANYIGNRLEEAETDIRAALRQSNAMFYPYCMLIPILGRQARSAEGLEAFKKLRDLRPEITPTNVNDWWHFGAHPLMTPRFLDQFAQDFHAGIAKN